MMGGRHAQVSGGWLPASAGHHVRTQWAAGRGGPETRGARSRLPASGAVSSECLPPLSRSACGILYSSMGRLRCDFRSEGTTPALSLSSPDSLWPMVLNEALLRKNVLSSSQDSPTHHRASHLPLCTDQSPCEDDGLQGAASVSLCRRGRPSVWNGHPGTVSNVGRSLCRRVGVESLLRKYHSGGKVSYSPSSPPHRSRNTA